MAKKIEVIVDINTESVEISSDRVLTLTEQVRILKKEIQKTGPGPEQDLLIGKFNDINDELDKTNLKSREFLGALGTLPGPVGEFASSMDGAVSQLRNFSSFSFKDIKTQIGGLADDFGKIFTNIGKATGITKLYTTLNNFLAQSFVKVGIGETAAASGARAFSAALIATGIGALIVGLGLAINALMEYAGAADKAAEKQKEFNEQQDKMAKETLDVESQSVKRQGDLLLASEKARGASAKRIFEIEQQNRQLLLNSQKRYYNDLSKQDDEEGRKTLQSIKNSENDIKVADQNFKAEQLKDQKTANEKKEQENKTHRDKIAADNKTADDTAISVQREIDLLLIQDERKRQDKELENQKKAEEDKIKELEISSAKKATIISQIDEKYKLKQKDVDKKRKDDDLKSEKDLLEKLEEIRISGIVNLQEKEKAELQKGYNNTKAELDKYLTDKKISQEQYNVAILNLNATLTAGIKKIDDDKDKQDQDLRLKKLDDELKFLQIKGEALRAGTEAYWANQLAVLNAAQQRELQDTELTEEQKTAIEEKYAKLREDLRKNETNQKAQQIGQIIGELGNFAGALASSYDEEAKTSKTAFEKRKKLQKASAIMGGASAIINVLAAPPVGNVVLDGILKGLQIGFVAFKTKEQIKKIDETKFEGGGESASTSGANVANLGKNYADGGMINGPRHAQGGTMIEAEGGEAIMTRGSVTMFAPLLSAMNQMGGGTSFSTGAMGGARPDTPSTSQPAQEKSPLIMKTYVVSNELTTEAEKQARLKDLSTL